MFTCSRPSRHKLVAAFLVAVIVVVSGGRVSIPRADAATTITGTLVNTIHTSKWNPPSPDPAGLAYWPRKDRLMVTDSEVEEMAIFKGFNVYEATRAGDLVRPHSTMAFSKEPVGIDIAVNPANEHFFISDDDQKKVFEVVLGADDRLGTGDDVIVGAFSTAAFGSNDPEGIAFGQGRLYISDGVGVKVYSVSPGPNGIFDGAPVAGGDDQVSHFDVAQFGMKDPEGIAFNANASTLYIVDRQQKLIETTTAGGLMATINVSFPTGAKPSDITRAPASDESGVMNLYVSDRGVDNNNDPNENDGKIYEIKLGTGSSSPGPAPSGNLLSNGSFEHDANADRSPDAWSANRKFSRSNELTPADGSFVGRFATTDNTGANSTQTVPATAGTTYRLACSANVPRQNDATFSLRFRVIWLNASNTSITGWTIASLQAPTSGWQAISASKVAPTGTAGARVVLLASSLNGSMYVDRCTLEVQ